MYNSRNRAGTFLDAVDKDKRGLVCLHAFLAVDMHCGLGVSTFQDVGRGVNNAEHLRHIVHDDGLNFVVPRHGRPRFANDDLPSLGGIVFVRVELSWIEGGSFFSYFYFHATSLGFLATV